jgi:hypothetical protein
MSPPDSFEKKLAELTQRTQNVRAPRGFEGRMLARLAAIDSRQRESLWRVSQRAVGLALCTAITSVVLAVWHDARLADELSRAPDAGLDVDLRDP